MSGTFKQRLTLSGLSFQESLAIWSAAALFVISVAVAIWAALPGPGDAQGPDDNGPAANPTPTLAISPTVTTATPVSAAEALAPFFSTDGPDIVLLVASETSLTDTEAGWLDDIRSQIGPADALSYSAVTFESIAKYLTVFVIDDNSGLDVSVLAAAAAEGATVHLIGDAAAYAAQVIPGGAS